MKLFKNKLFLMLFASLFAICLFNSKCFASFDFTYNDVEYSFPDLSHNDFEYYIFKFDASDNSLQVISSPSPLKVEEVSENRGGNIYDYYKFWGSNHENICFEVGYSGSSSWYESRETGTGAMFLKSDSMFYSCNHDIYSLSDSSVAVFQGASQPVEETNLVVLAEIVEQQETNKVMEEILGILPIVIVVIVSLIAIRKAIAFLRTLLRRS